MLFSGLSGSAAAYSGYAQTLAGAGLVTKEIQLPAAWDTLMQQKGYRPLQSFYL